MIVQSTDMRQSSELPKDPVNALEGSKDIFSGFGAFQQKVDNSNLFAQLGRNPAFYPSNSNFMKDFYSFNPEQNPPKEKMS